MLFYIEATVITKMIKISGPIERKIVHLVNANNRSEAKNKYEKTIHNQHSGMPVEKITFKYEKIGEEIL